jgi:hypothetical protein
VTPATELTAFRLATWRRPLRTEPSRVPGRYHAATDVDATQYLCLHPLGPWAEFLRGEELRDVTVVRQRVWALRLRVGGLVRLGFGEATEHGVRPGDLVSDDHRACRRLAARLREQGATGAIVPSAALPGTRNVVLFGPRVSSPWTVEPLGPVDLPAGLTADAARPPAALVDAVRFRGDPHAGLEAWRAGEEHVFTEPSWAVAA